MLKYKGYSGLVEYDSDGKIFTGEVIGLRSVVTFNGRTPEEIEHSFIQSVDLYLDACAIKKITPEKPYSGRFNVRLPVEIHQKAALKAATEHESLNEWVVNAIRKEVEA
jgi:predicted HicB family RNase H-like nuclease